MPYFGPAPPDARPRLHRRSHTASHSGGGGGGAFEPLGALPRRTRPTLFSIAQDADANDDDADDTHEHGLPQLNPNNSLRISISHDADNTLRTHPSAVPFPRSSPTSPTPPRRPCVSRTASTPILLSNGKPLKSSLKSSSSSPQIALSPTSPMTHHPRARSEPTSPHMDHRKNVHFPTNELATVRVFNRSGKPASVSRIGGEDDTETETEGELSVGSNSGFIRGSSAVFPFPKSPLGHRRYDIDPDVSSVIPVTHQPPHASVFLESLTFTPSLESSSSSAPGLSGTLLVRNIAYEKHVAVRFTLDDWQTTSEVSAKHLVSLPSLPSTFIDCKKLTFGDIIALSPHQVEASSSSSTSFSALSPQWDRFTFKIKLEDYAHPSLGGLTRRTMWLVIRYTTGTGVETWDNNSGKNYKIAFREQPQHQQQQQQHGVPEENTTALMQKRNRVFAVSSPPSFAPTTLTTPSITSAQQQQRQKHAQSIAETTLMKLKKLNLRNYAAPSASPSVRASFSAVARVDEKLEFVNGFPAHLEVRGVEDEKKEGREERLAESVVKSRREEESDTESEESIETPVPSTVNSIVLGNAGGSETGVKIRSRTPSPNEDWIRVGSDSGIEGIPLVTFSPASPSTSPSHPPPTILRGRQLTSNLVMLPVSSKSLDSHVGLEMGTSPPFSMMPDFTTSLTSRFWKKEVVDEKENLDKAKADDGASRAESIYWTWGGSSSPKEEQVANDGEEEEVKKERMMLLDGIREKSTSSPLGTIRRVSPPLRKSSPVKTGEDKKISSNGGVVSPQPRGKQDWSKVGSGWMNKPNSPRGSPSSTPPISAPPTASPPENSTPTPGSFTTTNTPLTPTTPTQTPAPANAVNGTQSQQDSVYQAFVRQWCFAQGPSHPVVGSGHGSGGYGYSTPLPHRRKAGGKPGADTHGGEKGDTARSGGSRGGDGPLVV